MGTLALRVFLLAACTATAAAAQRDTIFSWSKQLPEGARFSIRSWNGAIDVRPGTTDRVELRATIRADSRAATDVTFDVREPVAGDVEICTLDRGLSVCSDEPVLSDNHPSVRFIVELPKGHRVRLITGNGDVLLMQSAAEVDLQTGSGDVVIRESLSRVVATTGNGDVTVAAANGPVRASSGNGDVSVTTYAGPVNASSGNGDVDVRMITAAPSENRQTMTLSSGNGDVRITLPGDFSGEINASGPRGGVKTDFNVSGSHSGSGLRGTIGTGDGFVIRMTTGNGRLEIRKG